MENLIEVRTENGQQLVSARELYVYLEVKTDFTDWCKRMFDRGQFEKNRDFNLLKFEEVRKEGNRTIKREIVDYALTVSAAKEISMLQPTDKGKEARKYFMDCETKYKESLSNSNFDVSKLNLREFVKVLSEAVDRAEKAEQGKQILLIQNIELEKKEKYHAPMIEFFHTFLEQGKNLSVAHAASLIKKSDKWLFTQMRNRGFVKQDKTPTVKMLEKGYLVTKETILRHSKEIYIQTFITPKGWKFICEQLGFTTDATDKLQLD